MRDRLDLILSQWNRERRRSGRRKLGLSLLSLLVAMSTLFALLLPAFTLEKPVFCGKEEHRHDESCYERELICGLEEGEGHVHTEDCYTWEPTLICGLEESEEHSHTEDCYVLTPVLTCGLEECEGHVHTEDCYEQRLVCGLEEHEHELACYSDPGAVESEAYWKVSFPQFDDESPKERLLAIAASQLGYRESSLNYCVLEDGSVKGYTRYGDWYGDPYGDWCAMFLSFCLYYADIDETELPYESGCASWTDALSERGLYASAEDYLPAEGDLVFFDYDGDWLADHVGLACRVDGESGTLQTIEGNWGDSVERRSYLLSDPDILGYGVLPKELSLRKGEDAPAAEESYPAQSFRAELEGLTVCVEADEGAFPPDTRMEVRLVEAEQVLDAVSSAVDGKVVWVQAVDISFYDPADRELQPRIPIRVVISSAQISEGEGDGTEVVHVDQDGAAQILEQESPADENDNSEVAFEADSFSIYAVVGTALEKTIQASDGKSYTVSVSFTADAGVPEDAELAVTEIQQELDEDSYGSYAAMAAEALGCRAEDAENVRLFDIKILDGDQEKVIIAAPVDVKIALAEPEARREDAVTQVVHFADGAEQGDVIENVDVSAAEDGQSGMTVCFEAEGFSVYAIVDAPEPATVEIRNVQDLAELNDNLGQEFCLSVSNPGTKYFLNTLNEKNAFQVDGAAGNAARWQFEPATDGEGFYISTTVDGVKKYIRQIDTGNQVELSDQPSAFVLSQAAEGTFYFKLRGQNRWLQYSGSGSGIRLWTDNNNGANSKITITYAASLQLEDDCYKLDGKSFGIAWYNESTTAAALTAESTTVNDQQRLLGADLVMKPDVLDNDGILLVAEGSDLQMWTFESVDADRYYITATVNGVKQYLSIDGTSVKLLDEPDPVKSVIRAAPGTGEYAGKWHFTVNGTSLNLPGKASGGFNGKTGSAATTWMNLVEQSTLNDDSFVQYTAKKVSISDTLNVYNGQQVVLYTRIWNDTRKKYEFYAVDHDGTLIRCYDTGDNIEWIGSNVNTALWTFTEYTYDDGTPSYYYELQNTQYGEYIAPQVTGNQTLSDHTIGVNLNGRRYGESYSTIIAWDDNQYSYSGLKTENGRVVPCPLAEAEDFYFAVIHPVDPNDELTKVTTIDGEQYGIHMQMVDFNNANNKNTRDVVQNGFFGESYQSGLLSTDLGENGYPTATEKTNSNGQSLSNLFTGMTPVNHLFLESIYNESGYFEYDSTQNFAHLNEDGTFTVYDQLGAITGKQERKVTRVHGQFMPYNDIHPGRYAYDEHGVVITNQTDVLKNELPDTNPRKGEVLYNVGRWDGDNSTVDYFFGMEMSASFTQTADGLDAWGHDIIFEFSGDDDFWFYVDGELVLDLGGVHEAETGSINFRTGEVKSTRVNTTLYELFRSNYEARGMSEDDISAKLDQIFTEKTVDGRTVHVFKDYTQHTMKMFYMERGAGASNLHMRFNLAAVKPGTVVLSKKLSGAESDSSSLIEFPYQIYYHSRSDGGNVRHQLGENPDDPARVTYKDSSRTVKYQESLSIDGRTYPHVFFLKPGESAVIDLPDDTIDYDIVECGVNTSVYDVVKANGQELTGSGEGERKDFAIGFDNMEDRPQVDYDNHVAEGAMRSMTITKWLYDVNGSDRLYYPADQTTFSFRLYLGNEFTSAEDLPLANLYPYYVKDGEGNYCRWDAGSQSFVSLDIRDYEALRQYLATLTPAQRETIVFVTSMNGSISKIPADHSVEVRGLVVGTHFKVEERENEIPKGYTLRQTDGYRRIDEGHVFNYETTPIDGTLSTDETPAVVVSNQKGWGLTVRKVWSDKDFMRQHDDIFFAVYLKNEQGVLEAQPLEGTVRRLKTTESELYYFFDNIKMGNHHFDDFVIREVTVTAREGEDLQFDEKGVVSNYASVSPIEPGGTLHNGGTPVGGQYQTDFAYTVTYTIGEATLHNENVRTDTVTNSRPGLKIYKKDWTWQNLAGVVFTLQDEQGRDVAAASYSSGEDGLVTIAYLNPGTYTLTEIQTPRGYVGLDGPMTITVSQNGSISVSGVNEAYYRYSQATADEMAAITIRNRQTALTAKKVDADTETGEPLAGVHFALYWQVTDVNGQLVKDNTPIEGYEDITTDSDGLLPGIDLEHLRPGTYYLTETQTVDGYQRLGEDLCFTIGADGSVRIQSGGEESWLSSSTDNERGQTDILLRIPNRRLTKVSFRKVDSADSDKDLKGAVFDLYQARDGNRIQPALMTGLTSGDEGLLGKDGETVFELPPGEYHLIETAAPPGYQLKKDPVRIWITDEGVSYSEGSNLGATTGLSYNQTTRVYTLKISNTTGVELPATGGIGTLPCTLGGAALILTGLLYRFRRRRRERGNASP